MNLEDIKPTSMFKYLFNLIKKDKLPVAYRLGWYKRSSIAWHDFSEASEIVYSEYKDLTESDPKQYTTMMGFMLSEGNIGIYLTKENRLRLEMDI